MSKCSQRSQCVSGLDVSLRETLAVIDNTGEIVWAVATTRRDDC